MRDRPAVRRRACRSCAGASEALRAQGLIDCSADLEPAATALSSLSFGLMFVDQLVFGADCARLKRVTHVARVYAAGLAPQRVRRAARVR